MDTGDMNCKPKDYVSVGWDAVGWSTLFVLFNVVLSAALKLKMETSLIISSVRCIVQLTVMAYVLKPVLASKEVWVPFLMSGVFILLAAYETVYHQSKSRHKFMLPLVLCSIIFSCFTIGIIGLSLVIRVEPFYQPQQFVPIIGLLIGNAMSGIAVGMTHCLSMLSSYKDHIDTHLAMGASRWEAALPIAQQSLRLCMLPTINAMSVMGLISIPGMMTGQILGGADVFDAVRYQQISMFMIASSTALGTLMSVGGALFICIDGWHRLRMERIFMEPAWQQKLFDQYIGNPLQLKIQVWKLKYKNRSNSNVLDTDLAFQVEKPIQKQ